jgi:hypothetical protein
MTISASPCPALNSASTRCASIPQTSAEQTVASMVEILRHLDREGNHFFPGLLFRGYRTPGICAVTRSRPRREKVTSRTG